LDEWLEWNFGVPYPESFDRSIAVMSLLSKSIELILLGGNVCKADLIVFGFLKGLVLD